MLNPGIPSLLQKQPVSVASGDFMMLVPGLALSIASFPVVIASDNVVTVTPAAGASFGNSTVDGASFVQNTTTGGIAMGVYVASPQTLTTGKAGAIAVDINRNTMVVGGVAAGVADSGNPVKTGGKYNASAPTLTDGQRGDTQLDVNANTKVSQGTLLAGEDLAVGVMKVEQRFSYANMTTGTTTTIKSGAGFLHAIIVNTPVASATIKIYDNTAGSGTLIGTITCGGTLASDQISDYMYDVSFATGLTIVTSGATDITISYR